MGTDQFTFDVSDGAMTTTATANITVLSRAPITANDSYSVTHDRTLSIGAAGVLANDSVTLSGDTLTAMIVGTGSTQYGGYVSLNPDGSFNYTPAGGFVGVDSFTYDALEAGIPTAATVTINVTNTAPVVSSYSNSITHDQTLTVAAENGLLQEASDADGDSLSVFEAVGPSHGSVVVNSDGSFTYTPNAQVMPVSTVSGTE